MSDRRNRLEAQLGQARRDAASAEAAVTSTSAARLRKLMTLPEAQRILKLEDPALTSADRNRLRNSLRSQLRRSRPVSRTTLSRIAGPIRILSRGWRRKIVIAAILGLLIGPVGYAWQQTGHRVQLVRQTTVLWHLPSGQLGQEIIDAGRRVTVIRSQDDRVIIRAWIEPLGYAEAAVPRHNVAE
jgi:hypothetical protein